MDVAEHLNEKRKEFWESQEASMASMMCSSVPKLPEKDRDEVLASLPCLKGKRVLELVAGIGRFTGHLGKMAEHVTAVDFTQKFIDVNKAENGHLTNIDFLCADITELSFSPGSYDFVFSCWLFGQLNDAEMMEMLAAIHTWLTPGGLFFFREASPNSASFKDLIPGFYRTPLTLSKIFERSSSSNSTFRIIFFQSSSAHIDEFGDPHEIKWLAQQVPETTIKTQTTAKRFPSIPSPLDDDDMASRDISLVWIHTGGRVLDVGCGIGGNAFFLVERFGVFVYGLDISINNINQAIHLQYLLPQKHKKMVQFEMRDVMEADFSDGSYDVICIRGFVHSLPSKSDVFAKFQRWLRPGGTIVYIKNKILPPASDPSAMDVKTIHIPYKRATGNNH